MTEPISKTNPTAASNTTSVGRTLPVKRPSGSGRIILRISLGQLSGQRIQPLLGLLNGQTWFQSRYGAGHNSLRTH